jgi:hypothetical protein
MHLCGAFDIILALFSTAQTPPFPALSSVSSVHWAAVSTRGMISSGVTDAFNGRYRFQAMRAVLYAT